MTDAVLDRAPAPGTTTTCTCTCTCSAACTEGMAEAHTAACSAFATAAAHTACWRLGPGQQLLLRLRRGDRLCVGAGRAWLQPPASWLDGVVVQVPGRWVWPAAGAAAMDAVACGAAGGGWRAEHTGWWAVTAGPAGARLGVRPAAARPVGKVALTAVAGLWRRGCARLRQAFSLGAAARARSRVGRSRCTPSARRRPGPRRRPLVRPGR